MDKNLSVQSINWFRAYSCFSFPWSVPNPWKWSSISKMTAFTFLWSAHPHSTSRMGTITVCPTLPAVNRCAYLTFIFSAWISCCNFAPARATSVPFLLSHRVQITCCPKPSSTLGQSTAHGTSHNYEHYLWHFDMKCNNWPS